MTCRDTLTCAHEPFGDAWYFGPERLSTRYGSEAEVKEALEKQEGMGNVTYKQVLDSLDNQQKSEV
jgi:hypothetical protein